MLGDLSRSERLQLMKFVCSFAWADLEVQSDERKFVDHLASKLGLEPDEIEKVKGWLEVPPPVEEVDPAAIPVAHRQLFLDAARAMVMIDGKVDPEEAENLALFEQLIRD